MSRLVANCYTPFTFTFIPGRGSENKESNENNEENKNPFCSEEMLAVEKSVWSQSWWKVDQSINHSFI